MFLDSRRVNAGKKRAVCSTCSNKHNITRIGALAKRVVRGIAANANRLARLLHDTDAARKPRRAQLFFSVGKATLPIGAPSHLPMSTHANLECEALVTHVALLTTAETHFLPPIVLHK